MERVKIDVYISDLLYSYDCVIVPEFGGFIANYASAQVHAIQHKFTPPSKQISFNKNLKNNDGLLTNHIAERRSISYQEANELIKGFVNQTFAGLQNGDKIQIEKVGTLYLDPEHNIQFKAEEKNDFLLDSFGLGSFRANPIQREGAEERIKQKINEQLPLIKEEEKKRRKVYWPAAALILVIMLSTIILNYQFSWVNPDQVNFSSFAVDTKAAPLYAKTTLNKKELNFDLAVGEERNWEAGIWPYALDKEETNLKVEVKRAPVDNTFTAKSEKASGLKYHVMGGCFSEIANAESLVVNLINKGFQARLLGQFKNLHAVSYASFATREEAVKLLKQVKKQDNPNAWLLVKSF